MSVKQFRLQSANVSGKLSYLSDVLAKHGVNIRAISVGLESQEVSSICVVVDDPKKAKNAFSAENVEYQEVDVLAVEMKDTPGGLYDIVNTLGQSNVNVDYAYAFVTARAQRAMLILRVDDIAKARTVLAEKNVKIATKEEIQAI